MFGRPAAITDSCSPPCMKGGDNLSILQAGIPNITGEVRIPSARTSGNGLAGTGAFSKSNFQGTAFCEYGGSGQGDWRGEFDASLSNAIYGTSDTVQPPALQLISQIKY